MPLVKTEPGREALQKRDRALSPRERQILVITDGSRTRSQLLELLGLSAATQIDHLMQLGFLQNLERAPAALSHGSTPALAPAPEARRSLVATKVYCTDMLQLIREPEAATVMRAIQSSASEAELMDKVLLCLRYLQENTAASYASKVAARLAEIVPLQYCESLAECTAAGQPAHH
jgi:hypothetical protein